MRVCEGSVTSMRVCEGRVSSMRVCGGQWDSLRDWVKFAKTDFCTLNLRRARAQELDPGCEVNWIGL